MKEKIIKLRKMLPIPMMEAKQLLMNNGGDIETCVLLYAEKAIRMITEATGVSREVADKHYRAEKFDINRAISAIKNEIYDANYQAIEGVNKQTLQSIKDWIYAMETHDFGASLAYKGLPKTVATMQLIPELKPIATQLEAVKMEYDRIFAGYNDSLPLEEFVRRSRQLDDVPVFQVANEQIPLQIHYIKNEVNKHWRNV